MNFELWVDNVKILEPDFNMRVIKNHEDLIIVEVEGGSVEEKCAIFNSFQKDHEVYFDKHILDELKSYSYVGFSFSDEDKVLNKGIIKFMKVDENDNLKEKTTTKRKRFSRK